MDNLKNKYRGCLVGLAVGDCMGVPLEFSDRGIFPKITELVGNGPFNLKIGEWTDDTTMALCMGQSLIDCQGFKAEDQMDKYCKWVKEGYMSSTGKLFDIGNATANSIESYMKYGNPYAGSEEERSQGNGSIMRLAPIPMVYRNNINDLAVFSALSSKTTHGHPNCVYSCQYLSKMISDSLNDEHKDVILRYQPFGHTNEMVNISGGGYKDKTVDQIKSSGYVIDTLEAALWAFHTTDSFEEGCIKVINLADDSDTVGAVYGQLAGAYYGYDAIPERWREKIVQREMIENMADQLLELNIKLK